MGISRPVVFLHVGQCGLQIGEQILHDTAAATQGSFNKNKSLCPVYPGNSIDVDVLGFSNNSWRARCLYIDSEPRVAKRVSGSFTIGEPTIKRKTSNAIAATNVNKTERRGGNESGRKICNPRLFILKENLIWKYGGRGNNWAHGYFTAEEADLSMKRKKEYSELLSRNEKGKTSQIIAKGYSGERDSSFLCKQNDIIDDAIESLRKEVERCCVVPDFKLIYSIGGGTGSGVGSRILEEVRCLFGQQSYIGAAAICNGQAGGGSTPVEAYNSILAIQWLQAYADYINIFDNGTLLRDIELTTGKTDLGMSDLNSYISCAISRLMGPLSNFDSNSSLSSPIRDLATNVSPLPSIRFIESHTIPPPCGLMCDNQLDVNNNTAFRTSLTTFLRNSKFDPYTLNSRVISMNPLVKIQGCSDNDKDYIRQIVCDCLEKNLASIPGLNGIAAAAQFRFSTYSPHGLALKDSRLSSSVTIASCRSSTCSIIESLRTRAENLMQVRAYCHWFDSFGCSLDALQDALSVSHEIVDSYREFGLSSFKDDM